MSSILTWGYGKDNGPSTWYEVAPDALGQRQSPINIVTSDAEFDPNFSRNPLNISYTERHCRSMQNNGHSVQVTLDDSDDLNRSRISGGPLEGEFLLKQFHFHWGSESNFGSEHRIDGKTYAAELHLVHWNAGLYRSFEVAANSPDGLVVLAIFIEAGEETKSLNELTRFFDQIQFSEDHVCLPDGFDPATLLPADLSDYWTYCGSLTTPPCHESARFIIFKEPIQFSEEQLNAFRNLRPRPFTRQAIDAESTCCRLVNNFRPTMPLNGRTVYASFV